VFNQGKTCHQLEAKKISQNANLEVEYGSRGEEMAHEVVVGDNVAVLCQSFIDENFWIILIDILPICSKNIS
jgi:hypothetical protein